MTALPLGFALAAGLSLLLTFVAARVARRLDMVARPRDDRWHRAPTPLLGGVAIALAVVAVLPPATGGQRQLLILTVVAAAMATVGLVDDRWSMKPQAKLVAEILLAAVLIHFGFVLRLTTSPLINVFVTLLWLVGITNAFNLLDNMDGLSAGIALIGAGFRLLFFLADGDVAGATGAAVFMGAVAGFLVRNLPPASIFMGDAGSLFLGFFLAGLSLTGTFAYSRGVFAVLVVPVLLLLVPIFDTTFVTITRLLSGRHPATGGRDHTSHRLVAIGASERSVLAVLYGIAAVSGLVGLASYRYGLSKTVIVLGVLVIALILLGVYLARLHTVDAAAPETAPGTIVRLVGDLPYKRHVATVALDVVLIVLAYHAAFILRFEDEVDFYLPWFLRTLPVVVIAHLGAFAALGVYRGVWRYTGVADLVRMVAATVLGTATAMAALSVLYGVQGFSRVVFVIYWLLLLVLVAGSRLSFRLFGQLARRSRGGRRVLIYGAGDGGELAVRELLKNRMLGRVPVGFVDDDPRKSGTRIHGIPVLGGANLVEDLLVRYRVGEVVIASQTIQTAQLERINAACRAHDVEVVRLLVRLEPS